MNGLDEFGFIKHLTSRLGAAQRDVRVNIGDDAAVLAQRVDEELLVTTDAMVQGIHFASQTMEWADVGYKALAVSISDIAAMGGDARHAVVSLAVPKDVELADMESLYDGLNEISQTYDCAVVGGDVVGTSGPLVITTTVMGYVPKGQAVLRSGAKVGDVVFVTGSVGSSDAGLKLLLSGGPVIAKDEAAELMLRHRRPTPRIGAGQLLRQLGASSLNDVSDGLASELNEIASASSVRIRVFGPRIPIAPAAQNFARARNENPLDYALYGGEDYELVGTASPFVFARVLAQCPAFGVSITQIGRVEAGDGVVLEDEKGRLDVLLARGYNHFQNHEEQSGG